MLRLSLCLLLLAAPVRAENPADKTCRAVFDRLLPYVAAPAGVGWPPKLTIEESSEINAFAHIDLVSNSAQVTVCRGYLDHHKQDLEAALAFSLGHELSHLMLGHCQPKSAQDPVLLRHAFTRREELDADQRGLQTALKAGYRFRELAAHLKKLAIEDDDYDKYVGAGVDHPSWTDRVAELDKGQSDLWRSKSAFDSGVTLLSTMQFQRAAESFREVVEDFPECHEAWTNLSQAYLMAYVDTLNADYLKRYNVGMPLYRDFYPRAQSLQMRVRGDSRQLYQRSIEAARKSLEVQPKQVLAWSSLGLAQMVAPGGPRLAEAEECFGNAIAHYKEDPGLRERHVVSLLNNLACVFLGEGKTQRARETLKAARGLDKGENRYDTSVLEYNTALLDLKSADKAAKKRAIAGMQAFLKVNRGQTMWAERAKDLLVQNHASPPANVVRALKYRPVSQVGEVCLLHSLEETQSKLGPGEETPCGPGVVRLRYPQLGVEVYVQDDVFAIGLFSPSAPAVPIRPQGLGSKAWDIRVGDDIAPIHKKLAGQETTRQTMLHPGQYFTTYGDLGVSLREESGKVAEILITAPTY